MNDRPDSGADQPLPLEDEFVTAEAADSNSNPDDLANSRPEDGATEAVLPVASIVSDNKTDNSKSTRFLSPGFFGAGVDGTGFQYVTPLDPDGPEESLRRETAVAGAVTAVFLGVWSIIFSFFTGLAVLNAMLGIAFAVWGMFSTRSTLAIVGLLLCCAGFVMTMVFVAR